jgi:hypothetical protein
MKLSLTDPRQKLTSREAHLPLRADCCPQPDDGLARGHLSDQGSPPPVRVSAPHGQGTLCFRGREKGDHLALIGDE